MRDAGSQDACATRAASGVEVQLPNYQITHLLNFPLEQSCLGCNQTKIFVTDSI